MQGSAVASSSASGLMTPSQVASLSGLPTVGMMTLRLYYNLDTSSDLPTTSSSYTEVTALVIGGRHIIATYCDRARTSSTGIRIHSLWTEDGTQIVMDGFSAVASPIADDDNDNNDVAYIDAVWDASGNRYDPSVMHSHLDGVADWQINVWKTNTDRGGAASGVFVHLYGYSETDL